MSFIARYQVLIISLIVAFICSRMLLDVGLGLIESIEEVLS